MDTTTAVVLTAMILAFLLSVLAVLVFWHLARQMPQRPDGSQAWLVWWTVIVGLATITSATVAVVTHIRA